MRDYEISIGLEVHAQLLTKTKIFCGCQIIFGLKENTSTCPICLGLPGVLPKLNKKVVELAIKVSLALNSEILPICRFARKNYFYPDLPKNYQISQYKFPFANNGWLAINNKKIRIKRIHIEEDAGKLIHLEKENISMIDFNRAGVPLLEIVSEPDINFPKEAKEYLIKLREILVYLDICDGNMEEGSFRCDANISIRKKEEKILGTKVEIKNLNSFKNVQKALEYEITRQLTCLQKKTEIIQETRLWNMDKEETFSMRSKEESHDYRYFPEPDLVEIKKDNHWIESVQKSLGELPQIKKNRFMKDYALPNYDVEILTSSKSQAEYFEECVRLYNEPKMISNWIIVELLAKLKKRNIKISECKISPLHLVSLLKLIKEGIITRKIAKDIFDEMFNLGKKPEEIIKEKGISQIKDKTYILEIVKKVLRENSSAVKDYYAGKEKSLIFLVGQVMQQTKSQANPQLVNKLLKEHLRNVNEI